jgi:hypothetical protein
MSLPICENVVGVSFMFRRPKDMIYRTSEYVSLNFLCPPMINLLYYLILIIDFSLLFYMAMYA